MSAMKHNTSLTQLYVAVQNDKLSMITDYVGSLYQAAANEALAGVAQYYGFPTFWAQDDFEGWRVMLGQDLAQVMYGTRNVGSAGRLLKRYGLDFLDMRAHCHDDNALKAHFGLARSVNQISFATWKHFLIAGMKGDTPAAKKVCAYLLERERQAMVQDVYPQKSMSAIELLKTATLENYAEIQDVRGKLTVVQGGLSQVAGDVRDIKQQSMEAKTAAVDAQHRSMQVQQALILFKTNQAKNAQKYLEGESTLRMRVRLWELAAMKCLCCGCVMTLEDGKPNSCEIDEVRPRARGGNRTWDNVEPLCHKCNQERAIAAKRGERVEYSRDYRTTHPAFIAGCERELQRYERLRAERIRAQSGWSLPLFDCCVPS